MRLPWLFRPVLQINWTTADYTSLRCLVSVSMALETENTWVATFDITVRKPLQAPVCDFSVLHRCVLNQGSQGASCTCSPICSAQPMLIRLSKRILHIHESPGPKSGGGLRSAEVRVARIGAVEWEPVTLLSMPFIVAKRSASEVISRGFGQGNRASAHHQSEIASPPHDNPGHAEYHQLSNTIILVGGYRS